MVVLVLIVGLTLCIALMNSARHRKYRCIDLCSHRIMVSVKFSLNNVERTGTASLGVSTLGGVSYLFEDPEISA